MAIFAAHGVGAYLASGAGAVLSRLVDTVFPPQCAGCGVLTGRHRGVYASCWSTLKPIERPYCEVLGLPFSHDLGPGILSAVLHEGIARDLVHGLKYRDRTDLSRMMGEWIVQAGDGHVEAADGIVPVPLHTLRLLSRRFNQSAELSRVIAAVSGKPHLAHLLRRTRRMRQQVGLSAHARADNVRNAFSVTEEGRAELTGKRIVLVDGVYTTGATVTAAPRALKRAGVSDVTVLTFARVGSGLI